MGTGCVKMDSRTQANNPKNEESNTKIQQTFVIERKQPTIKKNIDVRTEYLLVEPPIGTGAFGEVYKAVHKSTGLFRAVKRILRDHGENDQQNMRQSTLLWNIDHPNIIKIFEIFENDEEFYIVTELCNGGQLFQRIANQGRLTQRITSNYFSQILSAVNYLHKNQVIHRDLKPQNIIFSKPGEDAVLKIIDFGASTYFNKGQMFADRVGTPYYIAPEILKKSYDFRCDLWSLGVMLYIMISGQPPFRGKTVTQIMNSIENGTYDIQNKIWKRISKQAKDLISKLLEYKPQIRITSEQALKHNWIQKFKLKSKFDQQNEIQIVQNIKNFRNMTKFQQAIHAFIVKNILDSQDTNKMEAYFKKIDINGDGHITKKQLFNSYLQTKTKFNRKELEQLFDDIDKDHSGSVNYTQFLTASLKNQSVLTKQHLQEAFNLIDTNKNGKLEKSELLEWLGGGFTQQQFIQIIKECNTKNQGEISKEQFIILMHKLIQNHQIS